MDTIQVTIDRLGDKGQGIGHLEDGKVIFVPRSVPGDVVAVSVVEERKSFARGIVCDMVKKSEYRQPVDCASFAKGCGGCQLPHISYTEQVRAKHQAVARALRNITTADTQWPAMWSPETSWHWRRRACVEWDTSGENTSVVIGFFEYRSKDLVDYEYCPQLEAPLAQLVQKACEILRSKVSGSGKIQFVAGDDGKVHIAILGEGRKAVQGLLSLPKVVGVQCNGKSHGQSGVVVDGIANISASTFAQASRAGNQALRDIVRQCVEQAKGNNILELFCGSGNLTSVLPAESVVVAVDRDVRHAPSLDNVTFVSSAVTTYLKKNKAVVDLCLLDPPREGALRAMDFIAHTTRSDIVYVSCHPATLARDGAKLLAHGWKLSEVHTIDMMPHTAHTEVVARFVKA